MSDKNQNTTLKRPASTSNAESSESTEIPAKEAEGQSKKKTRPPMDHEETMKNVFKIYFEGEKLNKKDAIEKHNQIYPDAPVPLSTGQRWLKEEEKKRAEEEKLTKKNKIKADTVCQLINEYELA